MSKARGNSRRDSVLRKQRPRSQRGRRTRVKWLAGGVALLAVASGAYLSLRGSRQEHAPMPSATSEQVAANHRGNMDWHFTLKLDGETPLADAVQSDILSAAAKTITDGSQDDLRRVAHAVQKLAIFADIRLIKLAPREVVISVRQRQPVLCVEADRLRYVTASGEIYGEPARIQDCPGPVLSGLFDQTTTSRLSMASDMTLLVDKETATLVREAIALVNEAQAKGLPLTQIEARKYRGLVAVLAGRTTEVAFGRAPFTAKLEKLQGILDKLAQKQEQAQRIELDYQGKAFIKLKKM